MRRMMKLVVDRAANILVKEIDNKPSFFGTLASQILDRIPSDKLYAEIAGRAASPSMVDYETLGEEIDYSQLSEHLEYDKVEGVVDYRELAEHIEEANIANEIDHESVAYYLNYDEIAEYVDNEQIAEKVREQLQDDIEEAVQDQLKKHVVSSVQEASTATSLSPTLMVDRVIDRAANMLLEACEVMLAQGDEEPDASDMPETLTNGRYHG